MTALLTILWFIGLVISVTAIFQPVGLHRLVSMFPEGRRWWIFPAQLASLAAFAALSIFHPFGV